jgi:small-conductance mechanosensitive channel
LVDSFFLSIVLFLIIQLISDKDNLFLRYIDDNAIFAIINKFKKISFVWLSWLGFARLIKNFEKFFINSYILEKTNDITVIRTITKSLTFTVYIVMGFMLMNIFGLQISRLLAIIGGPAAIIIFAGKTAISDLLSGISILINKSFSVGEGIIIPERNINGEIVKIGLKKITILTIDQKILTVPNSILSSVSIINKTKIQKQQIYIKIFIENKYASLIDKITLNVKNMLLSMDEIDKSLNVLVFCNSMDYNLNFVIEMIFYTEKDSTENIRKLEQSCFLKANLLARNVIKNKETS